MIEDKLRDTVQLAVQTAFELNIKIDDIEISKPSAKNHGDFSTNIAFKIVKEVKRSPKEIAEELANKLTSDASFEKVEALNGFINFFLAKENYYDLLKQILAEKEDFGNLGTHQGQKIQIEFISANPTGPLTLGNGRGGYGGDALANVYKKAGAEVIREYYVNDGGNQVKILGESILVAAGLLKKEEDIYRGEYIDKWVAENKETIEKLKDNPKELGTAAAEDIMEKYIKKTIAEMGIKFDVYFSERSLYQNKEVEKTLDFLKKKNMTCEKEGAVWLKTTEFGDDKDRVIIKSNGEPTYVTPDIAYHWNKFEERKFDKVIDILGADHHGYTLRMLYAVAALGFEGKLEYILTQLVRLIKDGKEFRMSKRKGTYVTIDDLFELIGGETKEASDVARFFFLMRSFNTHMDFDLDLAREHSEKNPVFYVKYAYARLSGILRNAKELKLPEADLSKLGQDAELELIDQLSQLPSVVNSILMFNDYPVHFLAFYAIDVARKFHLFYDKCRVIDENDLELTAARLKLVEATQIVLGIVMRDLIGIDTPERM